MTAIMLGAGDGNRTHVISLEGWSSTIELHPHIEALNKWHKYLKTRLAIIQHDYRLVYPKHKKREDILNGYVDTAYGVSFR